MTTQIATTTEQSQRLIDCGVPIDTADMSRNTDTDELFCEPYRERSIEQKGDEIPAWSLMGLFDILSRQGEFSATFGLMYCCIEIKEYAEYKNPSKNLSITRILEQKTLFELTPFKAAVNMIEYLVDNGRLKV